MRTLMLTPFAPCRDGIANYAVQEVAAMRRAGEDVAVCSPTPSAAHHHIAVATPRGMIDLARLVAGYDRLVVQAYPDLFATSRNRLYRLSIWLLWIVVARRVATEFRIHEFVYDTATTDPLTQRTVTTALASLAVRSVHTEPERAALEGALPGIGPVTVVDHGARFTPRTSLTAKEARRSLGIDEDGFVFVSIGFVQHHKGFDRAVRAFSRLAAGDHRLYVVGDIRLHHPDLVDYRDDLDHLIGLTPRAERRAGYVGDGEFDRWIVAADCVVLPYRQIWSSSIVERAALLATPAIVTAVGGLADQAAAGTTIVANDRELFEAMAAAAGVAASAVDEVDPGAAGLESAIKRRAGSVRADGVHRPSDAVRGVTQAVVPHPDHHHPAVRVLKTTIRRLTAWLIEPTAVAVNDLRDGTIEAVGELESADGEHR